MKRYTNQYRNQAWLYTVYCEDGGDDHILVAVVPAVGWWDIAIRLTPDEVETLRRSEEDFTQLVNQFLSGRESPRWKTRRIESLVRAVGKDGIVLMEEADTERTSVADPRQSSGGKP